MVEQSLLATRIPVPCPGYTFVGRLMLAAFHVPIADLRTFFSDELGKVGPRNASRHAVGPMSRSDFLRSVGLPQTRWLGPGNDRLNEQSYYSLGRVTRCETQLGNRPPSLNVSDHRILKRYYQLDEVVGRFELAIPIGARGIQGLDGHPSIATILRMLRGTKLFIDSVAMKASANLEESTKPLALFIQSRTTRERDLKKGQPIQAVFTSFAVLFLEIRIGEIAQLGDVRRIDISLPLVRLYYGYMTRNVPCWVIEHDGSEQSKQNARLLRMHLSRLYCQQSAFRLLVQKLPRIADQLVLNGSPSRLIVDRYTLFLAENRRFLASLAARVAHGTGSEFGRAAGYASDMIAPAKVTEIIAEHQKIVTRGNILRDLAADVQQDSDLGRHVRASNINININILGWMRSKQTITQKALIPRARIDVTVVRSSLRELGEFFAVYGSTIEVGKQDLAHRILVKMQDIARRQDIFGPALAGEFDRLKHLFGTVSVGKTELDRITADLEREILA